MDIDRILAIAPFYVERTVNSEIYAATLTWDDLSSTLLLTYYAVPDATEEVENLCDLALCELLEECLEVKRADIRVVRESETQSVKQLGGLIYLSGVCERH